MANISVITKFVTEKGKVGVSFEGYSYRYGKASKDGAYLFWRCHKEKVLHCRGRIKTNENYSNPDKKLVPLVYVLMSRKTTAMYEEVFIDIKLHCTQIGCTLNPTEILTDFKSGLLSAVRQQFPNSRHRGCHFHFCQVWYIVTKK